MTDVVMPQMGESIVEGTLTKWLKKVGDRVERDEPLFEISTDKVDSEIPAPATGVLSEVLVEEGATVSINTVVARIGESAGAAGPAPRPAAPAPAEPVKAPAAPPKPVRARLRTSTKTFTTLRGLCRRKKIAPLIRTRRAMAAETSTSGPGASLSRIDSVSESHTEIVPSSNLPALSPQPE